MVELRQLSKRYPGRSGPVDALAGIDLAIAPGEFVQVKGPSGCGKSTLLLILGGMLRPTTGTVNVGGRNLYRMDSRDRAAFRAQEIGFVFQMFHLVPYLDVRANVALAARGEAAEHTDALVEQLGLGERARHRPAELSAGERQRTAMARALVNRPRLVLADEPTGNLDPENAAQVVGHLRAFADEGGVVVMVTHGSDADEVADRTIRMRAGAIAE